MWSCVRKALGHSASCIWQRCLLCMIKYFKCNKTPCGLKSCYHVCAHVAGFDLWAISRNNFDINSQSDAFNKHCIFLISKQRVILPHLPASAPVLSHADSEWPVDGSVAQWISHASSAPRCVDLQPLGGSISPLTAIKTLLWPAYNAYFAVPKSKVWCKAERKSVLLLSCSSSFF